ncbi:MAG: ribonuclease III [Myxococcaceae bacterium]
MGKGPTNDERIALLEAKLLLELPDRTLALAALTHKSWCNEHRNEELSDNERLEFLGDAVVDLAVSHRLMQRFPGAAEGELSKLRAQIVNEEGLSKIARRIGLGDLLLLGRGEELTGGREKSSVLADAFEAVIGAVYFSGTMSKVMDLVDRLFAPELEAVANGRADKDYKSLLQEDVQNRLRVSPRYRVVSEKGPDHEKIFEVEVTVGEDVFARSTGRSKKEAEQAAARATLEMMAPKPE